MKQLCCKASSSAIYGASLRYRRSKSTSDDIRATALSQSNLRYHVQTNSNEQMMSPTGELLARGSTAIEILVNDHQIIKSLLNQLVSTANGSRRDTFDRLKSALTVHNATEENLVYPALAIAAGEKSESQHLFHETAEADTLVFELDMMLKESDDARFAAGAGKLQKAVLEHIDAEENTAFPHLQKHADAAQGQQLTDDVRDFRKAIRFRAGTA